MVKHVILWKLSESLSDAEKCDVKKNAKENLEGLLGRIEGLVSIKVNINGLPSSNCDMMLDSEFVSEDALRAYSVHPAHVEVADNYVRPYTAQRSCLDYEI